VCYKGINIFYFFYAKQTAGDPVLPAHSKQNKTMKSILFAFATAGMMTAAIANTGIEPLIATSTELGGNETIVGVAAGNDNFTTLVAAVKAADLVDVLSGDGPFTVFAPINAAFDALPAGTVDKLLMAENKDVLTAVLTYHVVAGKYMAEDVLMAIKKNGGSFTIKTVQGGTLIASVKDGNVILTDEKGGMASVIKTDVGASNGVIHAIDAVVMPKQ
jgi:uncharacterized surface protein with fasciclin (FAS1) repeats